MPEAVHAKSFSHVQNQESDISWLSLHPMAQQAAKHLRKLPCSAQVRSHLGDRHRSRHQHVHIICQTSSRCQEVWLAVKDQ